MSSTTSEFKVGDIVTIGEYGKVHWEVRHVSSWHESVLLESGMTGRQRSELASYLRHWSP